MMMSLLIAIAAGCASALMFASISSGALIALVLFYLAPLPLMLAAIGWGPTSAALGGLAAGLSLGLIFSLPYLVAFLLAIALPAWWLGHSSCSAGPYRPHSATARRHPRRSNGIRSGASCCGSPASPRSHHGRTPELGTDSDAITAGLRYGLGRIMQTSPGEPDHASDRRARHRRAGGRRRSSPR